MYRGDGGAGGTSESPVDWIWIWEGGTAWTSEFVRTGSVGGLINGVVEGPRGFVFDWSLGRVQWTMYRC